MRYGRGKFARRTARRWRPRTAFAVAGLVLLLPVMIDGIGAVLHAVRAPDASCRILSVIDGDTVMLWCGGGPAQRARLTGFDAPELFSPQCPSEYLAAQKAKWNLRGMILAADTIAIHPQGRDRYGRELIEVRLNDQPLARMMLQKGLARPYAGGHRGGWCD